MTTRATRPVFREVAASIDGRALVVGIYPNGFITVRLKGTQRTAEIPATWLYRNRLGMAKHEERRARRRSRKEAKEAAALNQAIASLDALAAEGG